MTDVLYFILPHGTHAKLAPPTSLQTLFKDALKAEFVICCKMADIHLAHNLLLFLQSCAEELNAAASPEQDTASI